jgi:hypothetical protein
VTVILVIIPTLNRPGKMRPLAENIRDATRADSAVMFVTEPDDLASQEVVPAVTGLAVTTVNRRKRNWAGALNSGYLTAAGLAIPFTHVLPGADDLWFADGWDVPALAAMAADPELRVAGTNDLHNPNVLSGQEATAYLIDRHYIDEAGGVADQPPGIVQCEEYRHNYTDTEFTATARARGVWTPCLESVVEHRHPAWGMAEWDDGYFMSQDPQQFAVDANVYSTRRHLWESIQPVR